MTHQKVYNNAQKNDPQGNYSQGNVLRYARLDSAVPQGEPIMLTRQPHASPNDQPCAAAHHAPTRRCLQTQQIALRFMLVLALLLGVVAPIHAQSLTEQDDIVLETEPEHLDPVQAALSAAEEGMTQGAPLGPDDFVAGTQSDMAVAADDPVQPPAEFAPESMAPGPGDAAGELSDTPNLSILTFLPALQSSGEGGGALENVDAAGAAAAAASHGAFGDFNGDGEDDLAVGVPYEDIGAVSSAGVVHVIYGAPGGLNAAGNQMWHQDSPGILDIADTGDLFGWALAAGDFDGDNFDDLAIGVPFEDINGVNELGAVSVLYGSAAGLTSAGNQLWRQGAGGLVGAPEGGDITAYSLTAGDFDNDGRDDLAVGVPYEDVGALNAAGGVIVIYGTAAGLAAAGSQFWHQDIAGIVGVAETSDYFGQVVAAGDFNHDGRDDLVAGVPWEDVGGILSAGGVNVIYGTAAGLNAAGNQFWSQDSANIEGVAETSDYWGWALAVGDFDNDLRDDLAIGAPYEDLNPAGAPVVTDIGSVNIIYGSAAGLTSAGDQIWHQDSGGILDLAESGDRFGESLVAGNFNSESADDLAIGIPYENVNVGGINYTDAGAVAILYGSTALNGLTANGDQFWSQDPLLDLVESNDHFGYSLTVGNYNNAGYDDVAIGVPHENLGAIVDAGAVNVIYSAAAGLGVAGNQFWHQDSAGIAGVAENDDRFGYVHE